MTMRRITALFSLLLIPSLAQAALHVNAGSANPAAGEGPLGADANYVAYGTPHENAGSGSAVLNSGVSFAEGGLAGTYTVGVAFSWPDATSDLTKQSFSRANLGGYDEFWETWVGVDTRTANGGINGADRLTLSLTGLPADTGFLFTSYHFDTHDQSSTFLVDQTPSASETATSPFDFPEADGVAGFTPWIDNAYTFDVTSDGSGNLDITYTRNSGTWYAINGFDLVAIPEPSTAALLGLQVVGLLALRRRRRS